MSDLIERDKVIEYCLKLIDAERKQGSDVMNYGQERINQTDTIIAFVENLPSADAVSLEEFEQMRFLADKSMEMVGEPTWADVLAELHERFDALEKELRRASAEMSAIIREHVDRPQGWIPCSERLPSNFGEGETVLATTDVDGDKVIAMFALDVKSFYLKGYVSAWMPLPEPWKGADDE